jgi:hypothetical protein
MEDFVCYLEEIVEPTVKDFEEHPTSRRHAFLACVAVYHAINYLAHPKCEQQLLQKFREESPEFMTVDLVAHAFKHVVGKRGRERLKADQVISRPPGRWGEAVWDLSRWDDPDGGVTLDRDRDVDLLDVVRCATAFLRKQIEVVQA